MRFYRWLVVIINIITELTITHALFKESRPDNRRVSVRDAVYTIWYYDNICILIFLSCRSKKSSRFNNNTERNSFRRVHIIIHTRQNFAYPIHVGSVWRNNNDYNNIIL